MPKIKLECGVVLHNQMHKVLGNVQLKRQTDLEQDCNQIETRVLAIAVSFNATVHASCSSGAIKSSSENNMVGDNAIPAFRFYRSAQPRFPLEAFSEAASALNADNSDLEDDVAETISADIGDCDLWVPEDEEEDKGNEEEDEENVENKISDSEIEASGNSRRTNKVISNLKCKKYVM
ncbi:hypothetical protein FQA39_LY05176 [Lamprigera yunnana]|nr:hypothetical protein FQA39_LY05176 [Lamprigera yunnana]